MSRFGKLLTQRAGAAAAGTALLMGGAGLTALAPSAFAGVTTPTVHCVLPVGQGEGTGPQVMDVTLTPANAAPGTLVHAVVSLGAGPVNSTQTLSNIPTTPSIDLQMSGGATGIVTITGPTVSISTTTGQPVVLPPYEADFIIPNTAQGVVEFTPVRTNTKTVVFGGTYNTPCDVVSGATSIGSVNVQGPGSEQPTLSAPTGLVRPGHTLTFAGLGWPASATPTVELCPAGGGVCVLSGFASSELTVSALGELSGTATLSKTGIPDGDYLVKVTAGAKEATSPVTVQAFVQSGDRVLTMTPTSGPVGTVVTLTGSNWTANSSVNVVGLTETDIIAGTTQQIPTTPDGTFSGQFTVTEAQTAKIRVREGISSTRRVILPFTVTVEPPSAAVSPKAVFKGGTATVTGGYWPGGSPVTAELCNLAGTTCYAGGLTSQSLTVAGDGTLSGSVTVSGSANYGVYGLKVSTPTGQTAIAQLVVQRTLKITKQLGSLYKIEGWDFGDYETVYVKAYDVNGNETNSISTFTLGAGYWLTYLSLPSSAVTIHAVDTSNTPKSSTVRFR